MGIWLTLQCPELPGNTSNDNSKSKKRQANREQQKETEFTKMAKVDKLNNGPRFLVLSRTDPNTTMQTVSPFFIKKAIDAITPNVAISRLQDGKLLLKTVDAQQAQKLVKQTKLGGIMNIEITEHDALNRIKGTISCYDLKFLSDEEILEELRSEGVTAVDRIKRKNKQGELESTSVIVLTFNRAFLPQSIDVGFYNCRVRQYVPTPMKCTVCLRFGHKKDRCRGNRICAQCGELYHGEQCTSTVKCANCQGSHVALSRQCPVYLDEFEIQRIRVTDRVSMREARRRRRLQAPAVFTPRLRQTFAETTRQKETEEVQVRENEPSSSSTPIRSSQKTSQNHLDPRIPITQAPERRPSKNDNNENTQAENEHRHTRSFGSDLSLDNPEHVDIDCTKTTDNDSRIVIHETGNEIENDTSFSLISQAIKTSIHLNDQNYSNI